MVRKLVWCLVCVMLLALPVSAKTVKVALDSDPESLDPHVQLSGPMLAFSHWVFDPLVRWKQDGTLEPRLALQWEQLNETTWRFKLRENVKFHSGNPFTSKDVVWTMERLKKSQDFKGLFEPFEGAKAVDDYTVDIITKKPYGLVLSMATYIFPMDSVFYTGNDEKGQPKDAIVKTEYSFANNNASGTGPFRVTYREHGVKNVLTRFKDYWDKNTGNVEEIIITPIKNDATRVAALLSGDVDYISPVPPQDLNRIKENKDLQLITMPSSRVITIQLNQKRRPEFKDKRVRLAIVHATDNVGIVEKVMKGFATPTQQQAPKGFAGYVEDIGPTRYDLEKAKKLMEEAGYPNGFECTMIATNNRYVNDEKIAEAFVAMMAKINIKVSLKTMPKAQYWDQFDAQVADMQMIGWHPDTEDSANYSEYLLMCPNKEKGYGQYNSGNYCNPELDALVLASQTETDAKKRSEILQKVERIAYEDAAFVPLHWQNLSWASKKNINLSEIVNVQDFPYFGDMVVK